MTVIVATPSATAVAIIHLIMSAVFLCISTRKLSELFWISERISANFASTLENLASIFDSKDNILPSIRVSMVSSRESKSSLVTVVIIEPSLVTVVIIK